MSEKAYSVEEVAKHNSEDDLWVIISNKVYDLTKFVKYHPGGIQPLLQFAGKDATNIFYSVHRTEVLERYAKFEIGVLESAALPKPIEDTFSRIPYTEFRHIQGWKSPFFNESHFELQKRVREWGAELFDIAEKHEVSGKPPKKEDRLDLGRKGIIAMSTGLINKIPGARCFGFDGKDLDHFHEAIVLQEFARLGVPGFIDGMVGGTVIGLPPVIAFGNRNMELMKKVVKPCLMGEEVSALAITEPYVGSDVAKIQTTAVKTPCGKFYIVNGVKKWITSGMYANWFTTPVRTGGPGARGISLLVIERGPGVVTKKIKVSSYSPTAGTSLVIFTNVKVPVSHLLGRENRGFKLVMGNFNHERWSIVQNCLGLMKAVIGDSLKWANQRQVFGKRLLDQPVIRAKLGAMIAKNESCQAFADIITYQMDKLGFKEQFQKLGSATALLKFQTTQAADFITDEATQIFGGRAVTETGMGKIVNRAKRVVKNYKIYGGSEEIMAELGVREVMAQMPKDARL